jgi:predicted dehydrogenase
MRERVGIGVVGAGAIGQRCALKHLSLPDVQDRVRLAAVCDPAPGRAEAAARKYGVDRSYVTFEEVLADRDVDVVTICSPIGLHFEQGMAAIEAGKHIHFNKTMTTTVEESNRLMAYAAEKGIHIVASPGQMLYPHNRRIRKLILEGALGRLAWALTGTSGVGDYHLNEEYRTGQDVLTDVDPTWYFRHPGGGPQYDVTVYCLHTLTGILGPATRVTALSGVVIPEREWLGHRIACDMDDTTLLLLDFGQSLFAYVYAAVSGLANQGFAQPNIYGRAGAIVGTRFGEMELKQTEDHMPHVTGEHLHMAEFHVFEDVMQLVDQVRAGTPTIVTPEHARHVIDIIESGYRAAETGQTQPLRTTFSPLPLEAL